MIKHLIVSFLYGFLLLYFVNEIMPSRAEEVSWQEAYLLICAWLILCLIPYWYISKFIIKE